MTFEIKVTVDISELEKKLKELLKIEVYSGTTDKELLEMFEEHCVKIEYDTCYYRENKYDDLRNEILRRMGE